MLNTDSVDNEAGKLKRQNTIRDILNNKSGTTHEEIIRYLGEQGIKASQSTLSRDLREMGVVKIPVNGGKAYYRLSEPAERTVQTLSNYPISYEAIGNILVIKTSLGSAPGFCVILDNLGMGEIAGTVAGDDTILVILRNPSDAAVVIAKLKKLQK